MSRSNLFANKEIEFKKMSRQELIERIYSSHQQISGFLGNTKNLLVMSITGTKIGIYDDKRISKEEKEFINEVYTNLWNMEAFNDGINTIYEMIETPIKEEEYQLIGSLSEVNPQFALAFLDYILAFAYCDGKFEDEVAERLDGLFGMSLLAEFVLSGQEEIPTLTNEVKVSKLEKEVYDYIQKTNGGPIDEIMKGFPDNSKDEIKKTLDSLVEKGTINRLDNIFNGPWYVI